MRRALAVLVLLAATAAPARAAAPEPVGLLCGYTSVQGAGTEMDGGPLAVVDDQGRPATATLTCSITEGPAFDHTDAVVARVSGTGDGAVVVPPTVLAYAPAPGTYPGLCAAVSVTTRDGETYQLYYDDDWGEFSADPHVPCGRNLPACGAARRCSPYDFTFVDALACPVLAIVAPPDGDLDGVWECPPYDSR